MDKRKRRIGYVTPVTELEEKFAEIKKILDAKKIEWDKLKNFAGKNVDFWHRQFEKVRKSDFQPPGSLELVGRYTEFWLLSSSIARLGVDITNIHERLVEIEKSVRELKLLTK